MSDGAESDNAGACRDHFYNHFATLLYVSG